MKGNLMKWKTRDPAKLMRIEIDEWNRHNEAILTKRMKNRKIESTKLKEQNRQKEARLTKIDEKRKIERTK